MDRTPIEMYLMTASSKPLEVLFWLLRNRDKENVIYTTLDEVAAACSVTKVTVNRVFQKLYADGFLVRVKNGKYKLLRV